LVVNFKDVNPDDAFSFIPYEKGSALLFHLEEKLGGPGLRFEYMVRGKNSKLFNKKFK
jgi:leukotriene-A4 hydrolase